MSSAQYPKGGSLLRKIGQLYTKALSCGKGGYNIMACYNPACLGNYDFERIAFFARRRFVEGCNTIALLEQAKSECEKEEIALVSLLDVSDDKIRDLQLSCRYAGQCKVMDCRDKLRNMIKEDLERRRPTYH